MIGRKDSKGSTSKRGGNFATSRNGGQHSSIGSTVASRLILKCPLSNGHHVLVHCKDLRSFAWSRDFSLFIQRVSVLTAFFLAILSGTVQSQVSVGFLDVISSTPYISTHRKMHEKLRRHHLLRILMA